MESSLEYDQAMENTENILAPAVGYSSYSAPCNQDAIMIKQNNTIINLLEIIIKKLNNMIGTTSTHKSDINPELENILENIKKISLGKGKLPRTNSYQFGTK